MEGQPNNLAQSQPGEGGSFLATQICCPALAKKPGGGQRSGEDLSSQPFLPSRACSRWALLPKWLLPGGLLSDQAAYRDLGLAGQGGRGDVMGWGQPARSPCPWVAPLATEQVGVPGLACPAARQATHPAAAGVAPADPIETGWQARGPMQAWLRVPDPGLCAKHRERPFPLLPPLQ